LTLQYDETLSNFAFKFNLRRYTKEIEISRLIVCKKLEPLTAYTFRTRAGVVTKEGPLLSST
jgi:hypothetical protein